jgi:hypothetical protein
MRARKLKKLSSRDLVSVKPLNKILETLDEKGCLAGLPFMPEMAAYCGKRLRVLYRIEKTCMVAASPMAVTEFINDDVVFLEGLRCSGIYHDACQRGCMIFWKEEWLDSEKGDELDNPKKILGAELPADKLITRHKNGRYFCQSTELINATRELNKYERFKKVFVDIRVGTYTIPKSIKLILLPIFRKLYKKIHNPQPFGMLQNTPDESLGLQPGDIVEVKPLEEIMATLDRQGKNKGLEFSPDMKAYCGRQFKVHSKLERMIIEKDGKMKEVKNTVILQGITCGCFYAFGGCPRKEFQFWREIWLKKVKKRECP